MSLNAIYFFEEVIIAKIGCSSVIETHEVRLLGVIINRDLSFKNHMNFIYKKAGKKLNALAKLCNLIFFDKRKSFVKAFVLSQFSFSPLVGMFVDRTINVKIDALHYRALTIIYCDESSFEELLRRDKSVTVHHKNIHFLAIELYKVKHETPPPFMAEIFKQRIIPKDSVICGLRCQSYFYNHVNPKSVHYGLETLRSLGPKIWNILPESIKISETQSLFKRNIKSWIPLKCPCRLCKIFLPGIGFI